MSHEIVMDYAGFNQNKPRITCVDCNQTILRQPHMNDLDWIVTVVGFAVLHPNEIINEYVKELRDAQIKR